MLASLVALSSVVITLAPALVAGSAIASHASIVGRDTELLSTYDYVIVGAGVAGLTVANRLSANPRGMNPSTINLFPSRFPI